MRRYARLVDTISRWISDRLTRNLSLRMGILSNGEKRDNAVGEGSKGLWDTSNCLRVVKWKCKNATEAATGQLGSTTTFIAEILTAHLGGGAEGEGGGGGEQQGRSILVGPLGPLARSN